jgi:hypothetical protein
MKKPEELENRAFDRNEPSLPSDPPGTEQVLTDIAKVKGKATAQGDNDLAARLAAGRNIPIPGAAQLHCQHCFGEGREAACRAIENWTPE